jgi:hypothetical protein
LDCRVAEAKTTAVAAETVRTYRHGQGMAFASQDKLTLNMVAWHKDFALRDKANTGTHAYRRYSLLPELQVGVNQVKSELNLLVSFKSVIHYLLNG